MNLRQVTFLRDLVAGAPRDRAIGETSAYFANAEGIGSIAGTRVTYEPKDIDAARHLLTSRGFELVAGAKLVARNQVQPGESEKWRSLRVTDGMVAVVPIGLSGIAIPQGSTLCLNIHQALAMPYEVLLFCENLEPMFRIHTYQWLSEFIKGRTVLALFRGAPGYFRTDVARDMLGRDHRPVLAFFDFDPKGLSMAAAVPRREALCLPPMQSLIASTKAGRRRDLYFQSVAQVRQHLQSMTKQSDVAQAWEIMNTLELGLDQEHFPEL